MKTDPSPELPEPAPTDIERLAAVSGAFAHDVSNVSSGLAAVVYLLDEEKDRLSSSAQEALAQLQKCVDRLFLMHSTLQPYRQINDVPLVQMPLVRALDLFGWVVTEEQIPKSLGEVIIQIEPRWAQAAEPLLRQCKPATLAAKESDSHIVMMISGATHDNLSPEQLLHCSMAREFFKWMGGSLLPEARGWRVELRKAR